MSAPLTDQEKQNLAAVLRRSMEIIEQDKAAAVKSGEIERSIVLTSRQAEIEAYYKNRGVILL